MIIATLSSCGVIVIGFALLVFARDHSFIFRSKYATVYAASMIIAICGIAVETGMKVRTLLH